MQDGMHADISLFLTEGMEFMSSSRDGRGWLRMEADYSGAALVLHGSAAELRQTAEALHRLADEVERDGKRQRALDNAPGPRRRTKFVAEPVTEQEEMHIAA